MVEEFMLLMSEQRQMEVIRKTNECAGKYGLVLSDGDIKELLQKRRECLSFWQRVEFGPGILDKIIFAFCDSDYIYQGNYAETIVRLQEIFYLYKNESMDELTDDELISLMREAFDHECQGSLEYLEETYLEQFAREIRKESRRFIGRYRK